MNRPIPKKLLIHSVVVNKRDEQSSWERTNDTSVNVSYVLVQNAVSNKEYQNGNESVKANALLFYDYVNSANDGSLDPEALFTIGDIVVFDGNEYHVLSVENTPGFDKHHLEVVLL